MALPKKIQGALALTSPTDEEAVDYNGQMKDLMGQLVQTPDQQRRSELLAWGGGLNDPSGNGNIGGALINANKAQSDYSLEDRKLRAQYIPMIMNALAQQQQTAQLSRLTSGLGGEGGGGQSWIGMPIDKVYQISQIPGQDLSKNLALWKAANNPDTIAAGSYIQSPQAGGGFKRELLADPKNPFTINDKGQIVPIEGGIEGQAALAGEQEFAKTLAQQKFQTSKGVTPGGVEYEVPKTQAFPGMFPAQRVPMGGGTLPPARPGMAPQTGGNGVATGGAPAGGSVLPEANGNYRGNFQGNPDKIAEAILGIQDPQERMNALSAYENQMRGKNPDFVPDNKAPVVTAGAAPGAEGLPPGAIQTGVDPMKKMSLETVAASNNSFMKNAYEPALEAAKVADTNLVSINQGRQALKAMGETGWGTDTQATAANILGKLGVPQAKEYASNAQIFQQTANQKIFEGLGLQKGVQTEGDAKRYAATYASLSNTPKANALILDTAQAMAERDKHKADYFRSALPLAQKSGDLAEIERRWAKVAPSIFDMPSMRRWDTRKKE